MRQLGELKVADYMTDQAIVIDDSERLTSAIGLMQHHRLSVLPVVDSQGNINGILSNSDLIEIIHEIQTDISALTYVSQQTQEFLIKMLIDQGDTTLVGNIMTSPVETVMPETNLIVAARKLAENRYHHLPVVDETGKPMGIIATSDLVRAMADHGALLAG